MQESVNTFVELYRLGCKMTDDDIFEHIARYEDLDHLHQYIESKDEETKIQYLYAINDNRVCMALPYEIFKDKRRPPDTKSPEGDLLIFACPGWDGYISDLIDQMKYHTDEPSIVKWKLRILDKMYRLGWQAYCEQYIEPLKDKEKYFRSIILGK